ncbi:TPA: hypothetical protein ACPZLS_004543, partial [Yersinia enterocolitica]
MKELDRFTSQRLESLCDYRPNRVTNLINFREIAALARIALAAKRAEGLPGNIYPDISGEITALEKILKWILNLEVPTTGATNRAILLGNTIELLRDCQKPIVATPQLNSPEIPDGWKLVPIEPTQNMVDAHISGMQLAGFSRAYRDMLAAAPEPQNQQQNIPEIIPQGWTSSDPANAALVMLDRIDTMDSADDDRIEDIKLIIRQL